MVKNPIKSLKAEHYSGTSYKVKMLVEFHDKNFPYMSEIDLEISTPLPQHQAEEYARVLRDAFGITVKIKKANIQNKIIHEGFPEAII